MHDRETKRLLTAIGIDFLLLLFSFFSMHLLAEAALKLTQSYAKLLLYFCVVWFFTSFWFKKFDLRIYADRRRFLVTEMKFGAAMLYLVSLAIILSGAVQFSRIVVFGGLALFMLLEIAWRNLFPGFFPAEPPLSGRLILRKAPLSVRLALADFFLLAVSFYSVDVWHTSAWKLNDQDIVIFLFLAGAWLYMVGVTTKFEKRHYKNIYHALWPSFITPVLMAGLMSVLVFALGLFNFSRTIIFGSILLYSLLSSLLGVYYFFKRHRWPEEEDIDSLDQVVSALRQEELKVPAQNGTANGGGCRRLLSESMLKNEPELFAFIESHIQLQDLQASECLAFNTHTPYNIEILGNASLRLFVNLHRVNDFRRINYYFLTVHGKLQNGGYFIGCKEPIERVRERFQVKYPELLAMILYSFHFLFFRIWPKVPVLKKIYFIVTKGRGRVLSRAELFGRLSFCGFKIVAAKTIRDNLYYIAQKVKTPSRDITPSYGPLIKIKKIGYGGRIIELLKFRTMHPYSEYIQDYVFENHHLASGGKFQDDFRVTEWGKVMRSLWIDELPQLYNWIRGDITLVGVRALSGHFFSLYPKELQELRVQFKPGLIPPFYADMPKTLDEIVASELEYLRKKQIRPLRTDLEYLGKAAVNIIFRGQRSG
ncbi:MAG TPA: sugar transferase [bacterium]|nr:sugar transferase [bacterium]